MIERTSRSNLLLSTAYGIEQRVGSGRYVETVIAAVKAIVAVATAINEMSAENDKAAALQEISAKLTAIISELGKIRRDLAEIKRKLDEIEDKIDQLPFVNATLENAGLQDIIAENYTHWASDEASDADLDDARSIRVALATNNRILMSGRKMSYVFELMVSFSFELDMALLLGIPKESVKKSADKMLNYLREAADPDLVDSIGFYHAASKPIYDDLLHQESQLDREDFIGVSVLTKDENAWGGVRCTYDMFHIVTGSLKGRDLSWRRSARNERSCYAYQNESGIQHSIESGNELNSRAVPHFSVIEQMLNRFIPHADVVEFTEEALPAIAAMIESIENRLEKQLTH